MTLRLVHSVSTPRIASQGPTVTLPRAVYGMELHLPLVVSTRLKDSQIGTSSTLGALRHLQAHGLCCDEVELDFRRQEVNSRVIPESHLHENSLFRGRQALYTWRPSPTGIPDVVALRRLETLLKAADMPVVVPAYALCLSMGPLPARLATEKVLAAAADSMNGLLLLMVRESRPGLVAWAHGGAY